MKDKSKEVSPPLATELEYGLQEMERKLRIARRAVEIEEPSSTTSYTVTFPQGRRPAPKPIDLREAYRAAVYEFSDDGVTYHLRVGERSAEVAKLLQRHGAPGAAFITAYNPASLTLGDVHNTLADKALKRDLKEYGAKTFQGNGRDAAGLWPPEPSLFVVDIERVHAELYARRYGQYAILWTHADGLVELVEVFDLDKARRYPLKVPPFGWVELTIRWGYEQTSLRLTPAEWLRVLHGEKFSKRTRASHDGEGFNLYWGFHSGTNLYVTYGGDGGTAYDGEIQGVRLTLEATR